MARLAEIDVLRAQVRALGLAPSQAADLAHAGSSAPWAAPVVSTVILVTFGAVMFVALTRARPPGSETILNMLLGTLAAMTSSVVSYWVGSSAGSAHETELLYRATPSPRP